MQGQFLLILSIGILASACPDTKNCASKCQNNCSGDAYQNRIPSLTRDEINRLKITFSYSYGLPSNFGTTWLLALCQIYPEYYERYPNYIGIPDFALLNNENFIKLGATYTEAFNDLVRSVTDNSFSNEELFIKWPCPYAREGYSEHDKKNVQEVFISVLRCIQDNFTQADADAWNKAWTIIWRNYTAGARNVENK